MRIRLTVTDTEGSVDVQTYVFDQPTVTIGRAPDNDLVLPEPGGPHNSSIGIGE